MKLTWPYKTAKIDSTQEVFNLLLVFMAPQVNVQERRIDQTIDENLPRLQNSTLATFCQEITSYSQYNFRRNNLPSAVTIPLSNSFDGLAPKDPSPPLRKKADSNEFKTQTDDKKPENLTEMGMEYEWKRVTQLFFVLQVFVCNHYKNPNTGLL